MDGFYTITQMTKEFATSTRTLRFYEDENLIHPERRGRTRFYSSADRRNIDYILRARRVGFTIAEIKALMLLNRDLPSQVKPLRAALNSIDDKRNKLRQQRRDLEDMIDELDDLEDACVVKLAEIGVST